jgi:hypothetical protein
LLSVGIDFLGLTASRGNVERGDTSEVANILNDIVQTPGNRKIMRFCQSVAIAIDVEFHVIMNMGLRKVSD